MLLIDVKTKKAGIMSMKSQEGLDPVVNSLKGLAQQIVLRTGGNLLWAIWTTAPLFPDANTPIRNIHPSLNIDTGPFSLEQLQLAKKQIVEGKAHDSFSPKTMKRVDIDGIIMKFCNDTNPGSMEIEQHRSYAKEKGPHTDR